MKKIYLIFALLLFSIIASGQAKKPSLMVVPSDLWCNQNGYMSEEDNMGEMIPVPDYRKALMSDADLLPVISRINGLMADRGFPLKNLESEIKAINSNSAETAAIVSKDGASVKTSALEQLRQRARADIIIQLTWTVNQMGPKRSITYTLQGLDSYTNKEIATSTGTGDPSFTAELPVLLAEAVSSHMDEFCDRLQSHFDDLLENGREISLNIRVFENPDNVDLESEYDGKELREIIEDWVYENTVQHRFNLADDSEVYMNFDEVRIPLYDDRGRAMAASNFARQLEKYLKEAPFNIPIKRDNAGLGLATLYLFK
ncbi:MAG TPA: hypothetical protein DDX40_05580 [Rikenellaceae bacterium]|nr:hypothetical protein [Rikenellaceae bacterium]